MTAPAPRPLSRLGRAAVAYAEHGWHVFPLIPRGKQPLLKGAGGFLAATADVAQVRAWWTQHPSANIGLWPGQSGLVILDVDGPEGQHHAMRLGVFSEPTLECLTGRADGGRHLYFRRPDFSVSNCDLAPKLDVRGDAGYVVVPPSIHPTGTPYRWQGEFAEIRELPPAVLDALRQAQDRASGASGTVGVAAEDGVALGRPAAGLVFDEEIGEGGRNNALTRYAGRLLAKGIPEDEALVLVAAVNQTKCRPPLPQHEVNALVANIATREGRKRTTATGVSLALVGDGEAPAEPEPEIPDAATIAGTQVAEARAILTRDLTTAPRWAFTDLDQLTGPMLPGDFVVVGSKSGNGKSTLLMSQMDAFAEAKTPTLYVPLEVDPAVCRLRWAAWKLDLDQRHVIRQDWARLPEGSREAVHQLLEEQSPFVHFVPDKRLALGGLRRWCRWAVETQGARVVMLDHLHRMDFGTNQAMYRVAVTETARHLKDLARELGVVLLAAAQLNRSTDPIDAYLPPSTDRLKESAGLTEEADVILMLSRRLKASLPDKWAAKLRVGALTEADIEEPGVMTVTCRKHRLDGSALNHNALLQVVGGRVRNRTRWWQTPPADAARSEPEPWDQEDEA